jgi:hypothetical protein
VFIGLLAALATNNYVQQPVMIKRLMVRPIAGQMARSS